MTFEVHPTALKTFAHGLDTLSSASFQAYVYAVYTRPEAGGGSALVRFLNATAGVRPAVEELFDHLRTLASASADEVVRTARDYESTDAEAARRADELYVDVPSRPDPRQVR